MNHVIELQRLGIDGLAFATRATPDPGPRQVLVRMQAASLNSRDLQIVEGWYVTQTALPLVPVSDGAGEIVAVGDEVADLAVGDRVIGTFWQRWDGGGADALDRSSSLGHPRDGVLQEYMLFDERGLVKIAEYMSCAEAATLPCAALTAWYSLVTAGGLKAGDTVLIQGTGGVAVFALQFARLFGATAIVTSSSDEKLERATDLGANYTINYRNIPDWDRVALEATNGRGVDHVIEIGGPNTLSKSLSALAPGGRVNVIGYLAGKDGGVNPLQILAKGATVRGARVGSRDACLAMIRALTAAELRPVIDRTFSWNDVEAALHYLKSGSHIGKVVIEIA